MRQTGPFFIAGCLLCLYGLAVFSVGSGTAFFLVWVLAGLICFGLAAIRKYDLWKRIPGIWRRTAAVLCGAFLFVFILIEGLILSAFTGREESKLDYVIVLGAQVYDTGPSRVLQYRLDKAAEYLEENPDTKCIVSGGKGYNESITEAEVMKAYLIGKEIIPERIILEDHAANTVENIVYSARVMCMDAVDLRTVRVGIITNDFHEFRSLAAARKQGFSEVYGIPAGSDPFFLPNNMLREFFGICKDWVLGNI